MIKLIGWIAILLLIIAGGFYYHYQSFDPCEWMTQELTAKSGLNPVTGLGNTAGLVMDSGECFSRWIDFRIDQAEQ